MQTGRCEYWESLSELGWTLLITADLFIAHTLRVQVQAHSPPLPTYHKQQATEPVSAGRQAGRLAQWGGPSITYAKSDI